MIKVGLTGGIGSGKSTVAKILLKLGFPVYNSDKRAKWLMNNDSILKIDTVQINKPNPIVTKKVKKKISRFKLENNPNYWIVSKSSNSDTSFYVLKNKRTGTKLSNKYYSKIEANNELRNFKKILSK